MKVSRWALLVWERSFVVVVEVIRHSLRLHLISGSFLVFVGTRFEGAVFGPSP